MKIDSSALAKIVLQVAASRFGDEAFRRRPLMLAVEAELMARELWTPEDDKLSKSKGIKSRGLAAIDFAISTLSKSGALENQGRDLWRIVHSTPSALGKADIMVRILPMSADESSNWSIQEQQKNYFLGDLSGKLSGRYDCKKLVQAAPGTPVLFQYRKHIIASARLIGGAKLPAPNNYGYTHAMTFDPASICVFEPVTAEQMKEIWPGEFKGFSQATKKLSLDPLDRFFELVRPTIRTPKQAKSGAADSSSVPGGWMASDKGHTRIGTASTEVSADHAKMQRKLRDELVRQYGSANVTTEQDHVDIRVTTPTEGILFEIKSDESPATVIRQAIGQLLEYAYLSPEKTARRLSLVIVGRKQLNEAEAAYLARLKTEFRLPLSYRVVEI